MRLFAALRERAGSRSVEIELPDGARVGDVWGTLGLGDEPPGIALRGQPRVCRAGRRALSAGDEVAVIPPVSGGAFRLSETPLSIEAAVAEVRSDEAGAIATFIGTTRARSRGRDVLHLEYEAYEGMAEQVMATWPSELASRHDLCEVAIHHRVGRVDIGETSVVIAVSAPHRAAALAACKEAIDELKVLGPALEERGLRGRRRVDRPRARERRSGPPLRAGRRARGAEPSEPGGLGARRARLRAGAARVGLGDLLRKLAAPLIAFGVPDREVRRPAPQVQGRHDRRLDARVGRARTRWIWGLPFAVGFVLLIFVHELGHVIELRRQGVPRARRSSSRSSARHRDEGAARRRLEGGACRARRARFVGSVGAAAFWIAGEATGSELLVALAFVGFLLNLFNLIPIVPLDGGRAVAAPASGLLVRRAR